MKKKRFNLGFGQTKRLALLAAAVYFTALVPYVLGGTSLAGLSPSMQGMSPQQGAPRPPVVAPQSKTPSEAPRQAARDEAKKHKREQVPGDRQHAVQADLPNELDRAQVCIIEYQDQQVQRALGSPGGVSRVAFQSIRKDIADIRGQLNLPPEPPVDAAPCEPKANQTLQSAALDALQKAFDDVAELRNIHAASKAPVGPYSTDQLDLAWSTMFSALESLQPSGAESTITQTGKAILPVKRGAGAPVQPEPFPELQELAMPIELIALATIALAILMIALMGRKRHDADEPRPAFGINSETIAILKTSTETLDSAGFALRNAREVRAGMVKQIKDQQEDIVHLKSECDRLTNAQKAGNSQEPSKTPAAQRQGPAQGDFPSAFGKSHNPVVKPDDPASSYPFHGSGQAYFPQQTVPEPYSPHPSPEPAPDPKALTGDPAGDYNRCLEMSQSEAEARLQNRYKEINRLTCANLEDHRNPNAKLMLRLDGRGNFLAMLTRDHRVAVLPLIGLDPVDSRRLLEGVFKYPPGTGKIRLRNPAYATLETTDTYAIRAFEDRGEFERD